MTDPLADQRLADLLDAYLRELQSGGHPDRAKILGDHPEIALLVDYVDALENMAPPATLAGEEELGHAVVHDDRREETDVQRDFGSYELLREIGRGGMGVVYKARQKGLDRTVAIKMILASHLASPDQVRRFQDERARPRNCGTRTSSISTR